MSARPIESGKPKWPVFAAIVALGIVSLIGALAGCQSGPPERVSKGPSAPEAAPETKAERLSPLSLKRVTPQEQLAAKLKYDPAQGEVLQATGMTLVPEKVSAGEAITLSAGFDLLGAPGASQVQLRAALLQGDKTISELAAATAVCGDGSWQVSLGVQLPAKLSMGECSLRVELAAGKQSATAEARLVVE